jgi:hypothetical protein
VGHGLRERQQRGPLEPGAPPVTVVVQGRRYLCGCGAVILVVPRGVVPRRHYSGGAIGWALALFGVAKLAAREVRRRVSTWAIVGDAAFGGWATLRRWVGAVRHGDLFARVRLAPCATARQVAERAAATLAAHAPPSVAHEPLEAQAFRGAAAMA